MDTAKKHERGLVPIHSLLKEEKTVLEISTKCNLATRAYVQLTGAGAAGPLGELVVLPVDRVQRPAVVLVPILHRRMEENFVLEIRPNREPVVCLPVQLMVTGLTGCAGPHAPLRVEMVRKPVHACATIQHLQMEERFALEMHMICSSALRPSVLLMVYGVIGQHGHPARARVGAEPKASHVTAITLRQLMVETTALEIALKT